MPRRGSPYGEPAHLASTERIKRTSPRCVHCNWRPATESDHQPPLKAHRHRRGTACCRLVPSCFECARLQGGLLRWRSEQLELDEPGVVVEPIGFDVTDPVWDVDWLGGLRDVPVDAVWPRFMSAPHPRAVGSYGDEIAGWAKWFMGIRLRWWQRLVLVRLAEHDDDGKLVWECLLLTLARQLGKSWLLRVLFMWRIHHADRFGEEQTVLHTGKELGIVKDVMRPAVRWAKAHPDWYRVREVNSQEEIEVIESASRWLARAKNAVYGYSPTAAGVDEAWKVAAAAVDEGIEPTLVEHIEAWLLLVSTSHRLATSLMLNRRAVALASLGAPGAGDLLIEWSAPRLMDLEDRAGWRMASPHWSERRERLIAKKVAAALSGQVDPDADDPDPIEAIRTQWLNQWPPRLTPASGTGVALLPDGAWSSCPATTGLEPRRVWVAVEDNFGHGAAVAAVALMDDDRFEIDGWLCESRDHALRDARATLHDYETTGRLILGGSIAYNQDCERAGATETRIGLPLLRSMLAAGRIVHDDTPELDEQLHKVRVREVMGGLALVSGERSDLVRATTWALHAATVRRPEPAIH